MSSNTTAAPSRGRLSSLVQGRLQAARERMEVGMASALNKALGAVGLDVKIQSAPEPNAAPGQPAAPSVTAPPIAPPAPPAPPVPAAPAAVAEAPSLAPLPEAGLGLRAFPTAGTTPLPIRPLGSMPGPAPKPMGFAPLPLPPKATQSVWTKLLEPIQSLLQPAAAASSSASAPSAPKAPRPVPQGPTPVQVMNAVQGAVVGAVKVVSGTIDGVGAAIDAGRAVSKSATGAAKVASGLATVASGFYPQLAALGIGVQRPPKNKPGVPPRRKVSEILANPIGRTQPGAPGAAGAPPRPMKRVQRIPMVRPKSSLALGRKESAPKPRSYADMQMKPQIGLTPHEILLKVATIALGKTLLGFLEAGARSQQKALQGVSERMSQKQIMLLGMLPAQYIVSRLPQAQPEAPAATAKSATAAPDPAPGAGGVKIRY